jgi:hypothetical protein
MRADRGKNEDHALRVAYNVLIQINSWLLRYIFIWI